jgi:hypothetical protein
LRLILLFFFLIPVFVQAQTVCTIENRERLDKSLSLLAQPDLAGKSANDLTVEIGQWFLQTPYMEKTLELPGDEKLIINLMGLDCTTYLETVVTMVRLAMKNEFSFEAFEQELEHVRYRDGVNQGYPSRLHYFSDWIYQNQQKGIIRDITAEIGGEPYENRPTFMTQNPQFYPQLSEAENREQLQNIEAAIATKSFSFIPKEKIQDLESQIQSGDLIAITTPMKNLDIVHVGFAIAKNGRIHLLHASSKNMKVEISELPLSDYLAANKSQSGIMVSRLTGQ